MKSKYGFTFKNAKNDFFYALVMVAIFVVSTLNVGAGLLGAGTASVVATAMRAWVAAATVYFASG